jgi:hypothetical protein
MVAAASCCRSAVDTPAAAAAAAVVPRGGGSAATQPVGCSTFFLPTLKSGGEKKTKNKVDDHTLL